MGQKTHPIGFRVGVTRRHDSRWYANKKEMPGPAASRTQEIRKFIKDQFYGAQIPRIEIDRTRESGPDPRALRQARRPDRTQGRQGGAAARRISRRWSAANVRLDIFEINKPELEGQIVAESISRPAASGACRSAARSSASSSSAASAAPLGVKLQIQRASGRRGHRAHRDRDLGTGPAADAARGHPLRLHRRPHQLRRHRRQGLDLPRRVRRGQGRRSSEEGASQCP